MFKPGRFRVQKNKFKKFFLQCMGPVCRIIESVKLLYVHFKKGMSLIYRIYQNLLLSFFGDADWFFHCTYFMSSYHRIFSHFILCIERFNKSKYDKK